MPTPALNSTTYRSSSGRASRLTCGITWKKIITAATAMSEMQKFTSWNSTFSNGKISFSMRIFLISEEDSMIEFMAPEVESAMRANMTLPRITYSG